MLKNKNFQINKYKDLLPPMLQKKILSIQQIKNKDRKLLWGIKYTKVRKDLYNLLPLNWLKGADIVEEV